MTRSKQRAHDLVSTHSYSMDRYKKALRLFSKSKSRLDKRGLPHEYLGRFLKSSYNLRIRKSNLEPLDLESDDDNNDENYRPHSGSKRKPKMIPPSEPEPQKSVVVFRLPSIRSKMLLQRLAHTAIFDDLMTDDDANAASESEPVIVKVSKVHTMPQSPVRTIRTAFAHPLDCELGNSNGEPCAFCTDFTFGMFGLGLKTVEVADYGSGGGLEELSEGHRSSGHERTRICDMCCLDRLYIINCAGHEISAIYGCDPLTFDYAKAFRSLEKPMTGANNHKQSNQWCSFCLNPAFFRCATVQILDKFGRDIDSSSPETKGCGLLLCENCKHLMDTNQNNIAKVIAAIPTSEGVRADVEFLVPGSDLHLYFSEQ